MWPSSTIPVAAAMAALLVPNIVLASVSDPALLLPVKSTIRRPNLGSRQGHAGLFGPVSATGIEAFPPRKCFI